MIDSYRLRMAAMGGYEGEARRRNAQKIMDASWMRDPATKPVFVKWCDTGTPVVDDDDEVLYAKYNIKSYYSISGDNVEYLLQFRLDDIKDRPDIKVGSYVKIPDEMDNWNWWLIVAKDDRTQFAQYYVLKCTWTYRWVAKVDGKRRVYECLGCGRKQNSYNSGVWLDYQTATIENQEVFLAPTNEDTKTIYYDCKFLKSMPGRYPPLAWKISKIEDTLVDGITRFTMTQEQYNPATDDAEKMVGNYYESAVQPEILETEEIPTVSDLEITYSGSPAVKAGGGFKKFALKSRIDGKLVDCTEEVSWSIDFPDGDSAQLETSVNANIFKVKCKPNYLLIGKTFTITATTKYGSKSLIVEVTSL